ncbi:alpha-mannosidase 2 isoform X2 [Tetranychus urticae]|uniref:alpha-mannosidase 2 isoform X2 n=1 Tax=Tetranychus urticae TaxID=32264 RepID=UPI00077BD29D|nr:alpha-mannosidase 2 isoform X2 [Tetranychus urticae]
MLRIFRKRSKILYVTWLLGLVFLTGSFYYVFSFRNASEKDRLQSSFRLTSEIHTRLQELEGGLKENRILLDDIRNNIAQVSKSLHIKFYQHPDQKVLVPLKYCEKSAEEQNYKNGFNLTMEDVYNMNNFENVNGGVWTQGWDIQINQSRWIEDKLKIFVVPHSHCDPGWLKTFDQYFRDQTRHILNNILKKLQEDPSLKFIWAETSFFAAWWDILKSEDDREAIKTLLDNGQLEIVTGGWVMNDEANTHYFAMISQMVDGHEWLKNVLNYKPRYGWAIDPFGLSPTMAFLLKKMGLKAMVIQRVHYSIKKYLAQKQSLEFKWRQYWETNNVPKDDISCHIEPFYSYDVPHTCGPDPKVCCQFDFKRLPPNRLHCPWKVPPQRITDQNIAQRAAMLVEQYRKKATLYRKNSLLVPLGDDFRFDKLVEWDNQVTNYQKLFDYINAKTDWNIEIKWGTLSDYFESFDDSDLPALSGDFFTYADRDDNYWSGFYTTRPYFKRLDRILESYVRGAEILFSIGSMLSDIDATVKDRLSNALNVARTNLAIFQHHDGITGTAKDPVVNDYGFRMITSLQNCQAIISTMSFYLLHLPLTEQNTVPLTMIDLFPNHNLLLPIKDVIQINDQSPRHLVIYNSLGMQRKELICILIPKNISNWIIRDHNGKMVEEVQVNQAWDYTTLLDDIAEACFFADLEPLSLVQYTIEKSDTNSSYESSTNFLYNFPDDPKSPPAAMELEMEGVKLLFNGADGMLRKVILHQGDFFKTLDLRLKFMFYGTRAGNKKVEKSGAYLFLPDSAEAQDMAYSKPLIRITDGPLVSRMEILIDNAMKLRHQITLVRGKPYFEIENEFHMVKGSFDNKELLLRFFSDVQNDNTFYTDLNGFQMVKRKWFEKLPVQGNVYPMPSLMYIEDAWTRLNILSAQPLGVTSQHPGMIDIFLDRRLLQDDNRGVGQGVTDHRRTREKFRVAIENRGLNSLKPTSHVQRELLKLLNEPFLMQSYASSNHGEVQFMPSSLPCDVHLLNFRSDLSTLNEFYLFLHRFGSTCESQCPSSHPFTLLPHLSRNIISAIQPTMSSLSLSLNHVLNSNLNISSHQINLDQMDFAVFSLKLK